MAVNTDTCKHPPQRLYSYSPGDGGVSVVACCDCGKILKGASPDPSHRGRLVRKVTHQEIGGKPFTRYAYEDGTVGVQCAAPLIRIQDERRARLKPLSALRVRPSAWGGNYSTDPAWLLNGAVLAKAPAKNCPAWATKPGSERSPIVDMPGTLRRTLPGDDRGPVELLGWSDWEMQDDQRIAYIRKESGEIVTFHADLLAILHRLTDFSALTQGPGAWTSMYAWRAGECVGAIMPIQVDARNMI